MPTLKIGRRSIEVSNLQKILFPKDKITKGDILDYYERIAKYMVPHMKNRPITMQRFPDGIRDNGFYQKNISDYFPKWIDYIPIKKQEDGVVKYAICNDAATLIYLANQLCLTPHLWLSKVDDVNTPDRIIFDLDPSSKSAVSSPTSFANVKKAAVLLKALLEELGLTSYVMTTGSRGAHVVVPLKRNYDFDEVRDFARDVAELLVSENPKLLTIEVRKGKRRGRIFVDYLRNAFGQTAVAPYAVRAKPGAPVATPITWQELRSAGMHAQRFTIKNIFKRLSTKKDPWHDIDKHAQSLAAARKKLNALKG